MDLLKIRIWEKKSGIMQSNPPNPFVTARFDGHVIPKSLRRYFLPARGALFLYAVPNVFKFLQNRAK